MDYKSVYFIYEETLNSLCHDKNNWLQLLDCISNNYLYSFYEQVLIYAQKPTAQAVKEIGKWNDANRYVNKGTKGIALLAERNGYPYLKYVFDIADTNSKLKRKVNFWTIPFSFENDLISSNIPFSTLAEAIVSSSKVVSSLQDNDVLSSSTAYVILKRCNLNPEDYMDYNIFNSINRNDIVKLGVEISNNSKTLLYLIYQEIQNIKEKEIDKIYIFENNFKTLYDDNNERSNDYENDLQKSWQLPTTEHYSANSKESTRKILNNEVELSETEQSNIVSRNDDVGRTKPTFDRGSNYSGTKIGRIDTNSNGTREHYRRNETEKSNEVDTKNEPNKSDGRGNDTSRIDLQLNNNENGNSNSLFVSDKKQLSLFQDNGIVNSEETILSEKEIKDVTNYNFRLEQVEYNSLTDTEKFKNNIEAIKVLKICEKENRLASSEEQDVLSKYIGWGGLSRSFEENNVWSKELKDLLNEEEYNSAMESTLTSFYTSPMIIQAIYKVFLNANIKVGKILEPSCGIGNFFGLIPDEFQNSKIYGVEIDSISSRIAKKLYPNVNIINSGYEDTDFKNDFFDIVIGNIPFSDYKVNDKKYNNLNSFIHDYFFIKSLDKVKIGGIIAFITTKGTMDKENSDIRKYISQRANLLGAIRLPDNIFNNAGTRVTTDIIFLQKREFVEEVDSEWLYLDTDINGIKINKYYVEHPDMVCGNMVMETSRFGMRSACKINDSSSFEKQLNNAISKINIDLSNYRLEKDVEDDELNFLISSNLNIRNYSYVLNDDKICFYKNGNMYPQELKVDTQNRIKHLIEIRDCTRLLIDFQVNNYSDEDIKKLQKKLNTLYDKFVKKFGLINNRNNTSAFSDDSSFYLLCSLEVLDENKNFKRKADMFFKRTINPHISISHVDTAQEALALSISEKAHVDIQYMCELTNLDGEKITNDLIGQIFLVPSYDSIETWQTADEYLSGNVREKLKVAKSFAKINPKYEINVQYLQNVQPKDLEVSEISVRLGATWIPTDVIDEFLYDLLDTPQYRDINVKFDKYSSQWYIENKNRDRGNINSEEIYGTRRINAYYIIEDTLNLKNVKIYDYVVNSDGKKKAILNIDETSIAQAKQQEIKEKFVNWIWEDMDRRERLCKLYNEKFNNIRMREFDGSHIRFVGMNPEITLKEHQVNAVARILYSGNTLLAHCVGAGKTYTMVAAAMESKRIGLCHKSMFVVPNHLIEQFASEFLQLYPASNLLVSTKKDFEAKNRKIFTSKIATGDYDAVIISHSQFEKIPISIERQQQLLKKQIDDIIMGIAELKKSGGENFTIKQMVKTKKQLETKLKKLNDTSKKDDVICFEELGIDKLFVDEAHYFKNLFLYTKIHNVAGISQTDSQRASDLYMKCRYLDEVTHGKGIVFATGTPISNSMVELYTMQRYLQYPELEKRGLQNFDAWASTFGEIVNSIELSVEGKFRIKNRFSKFYNLPELINLFKEVADIQTADMLNLPTPKAVYKNVVTSPTPVQKELLQGLVDRAENIRHNKVDPRTDNMLKITLDGKKLSLDQRLLNDMLPDDENNKTSICANNIYQIWKEHENDKLTQLVFCDLSTPSNQFNVYDDLRNKLISMGIPKEDIEFIHNAQTDNDKRKLFLKVRNGEVRILFGSTQKMGAGTNCQDKLIAIHNIDCPWRPSDLQQREGRIIRQGNQNPEAYVYRYVTSETFDAYLYQTLENKQKFISQVMTSKVALRSMEDIDEVVLSYAEIKALATNNPEIIEKIDIVNQVSKLKLLKQSYLNQKYSIESRIAKFYPQQIDNLKIRQKGLEEDFKMLNNNEVSFDKMVINDITYYDNMKAGSKILELCKNFKNPLQFGSYKGFKIGLQFDSYHKVFVFTLSNQLTYRVNLGTDALGNITRINNVLSKISNEIILNQQNLDEAIKQLEIAKQEVQKPFQYEQELSDKLKRQQELNLSLSIGSSDNNICIDDNDEVELTDYKKVYER